MSQPLKILWQELVDAGYEVRSKKLDGLKSWQPFKAKYSGYVLEGYENGIPLKKSFVDFVGSLDYQCKDLKEHTDVVININGIILQNTIEPEHFFVQHCRIPKLENYKLPVVKILQLAYNVGQLKAVFEHENVYSDKFKNFYYNNHLEDISAYLDPDIYDSLVVEKNTQQGGNALFHKKYLKYKRKYLDLRNSLKY